jgi:hypothetical protein
MAIAQAKDDSAEQSEVSPPSQEVPPLKDASPAQVEEVGKSRRTQQCNAEIACREGQSCSDGTCVLTLTSACSQATECSDGYVCNEGICTLANPASDPSTISISTNPPGAGVFVDGKPVDDSPCRVAVMPGYHQIESRMPGYVAQKTGVDVRAGVETTVSLVLLLTLEETRMRALADRIAKERRLRAEALAGYEQELTAWRQTSKTLQAERRWKSYVGGVTLAAGTVLVVGGAALYVAGFSKGDRAHDQYEANTDPSRFSGYRKDIRNARTMLLVANVLTGVGIPSLIAGSVLLSRRPRMPEAPQEPQLDFSAIPILLSGGGGVAAAGHF